MSRPLRVCDSKCLCTLRHWDRVRSNPTRGLDYVCVCVCACAIMNR
jgi:hypothetical protein